MKTSQFERLRKAGTIVLAAGHGDGDPGAENGKHKEAEQAVIIADEIARILRGAGLVVDVVSHTYGAEAVLGHVNDHYDATDAWAVEIHRGSADGIQADQASWQCGVYHYPSQSSTEIAVFLAGALRRFQADPTTWARPDTQSPGKSLAWVRRTQPVAHLLELGYMQGDNTRAHLLVLADMAARSLYEAFTGLAWADVTTPLPVPATTPAALPLEPAAAPTPAASLLDQLVAAYKAKDLGALFARLNADVHSEDHDDLQNASLAQWILESGWAKSDLATQHFNFAGLKYRENEMKDWPAAGFDVKPVKYKAWDGEGIYCKFPSPSAFIDCYWRFIMRPPYKHWEDHASNPKDYISFLLACGYTTSNTYLGEVLNLVPKAIALLGGAPALPVAAAPVAVPAAVPAPLPVVVAAPPVVAAPAPVPAAAPAGQIDSSHWFSGATRAKIGTGPKFKPLCVVIHYTEGFSADGSIDGWRHRTDGVLAHVVVDHDGTVYQCRPFNQICLHAGASRWNDPVTGTKHNGVNAIGIGIEIANTGMKENLQAKLNTPGHPKGTTMAAKHRNGKFGSDEASSGKQWEVYPEAQLKAVFNLVSLLMARYDLHDITGHDCISPKRKADPGPAFPMKDLRAANGLTGLPVVLDPDGTVIPV